MVEQHGFVLNQSNGRMELMGVAAELSKLSARGGAVGRLGKAIGVERQRLIGAQNQPAGTQARHRSRLLPR